MVQYVPWISNLQVLYYLSMEYVCNMYITFWKCMWCWFRDYSFDCAKYVWQISFVVIRVSDQRSVNYTIPIGRVLRSLPYEWITNHRENDWVQIRRMNLITLQQLIMCIPNRSQKPDGRYIFFLQISYALKFLCVLGANGIVWVRCGHLN